MVPLYQNYIGCSGKVLHHITLTLELEMPSWVLGLDFPGSSAGKESACNVGDLGSIPGLVRSRGERIGYLLQYSWASLVAQMVKNPPAMREPWGLRSLSYSSASWKLSDI